MRILLVEELEQRQLLSGAGFSPQPPPMLPTSAGTFTTRAAERSPSVDYVSGCNGPVGQGMPGGCDVRSGQSWSDVPYSYTGRSVEAAAPRELASINPVATRPDTRGIGTNRFSANQQVTGPDSTESSETARVNPAAITSAPEQADGNRGANVALVEALLGIFSQRPNPQLEILIGTTGLHIDVQALSPVRSFAWALREASGVSAAAIPTTAVRDGEQSEEGSLLPSPRVSGVPSSLPPFGLSALELGMQHLLEQLERIGTPLDGHRDGSEFCLWIVAAATATAACEIARRQLRLSSVSPVVDVYGIPGSDTKHLFAG